ncbi:MAG: dockerin type I domain-containing protein [archaeon]
MGLDARAAFSDDRAPYLFYDGGTTWKLRYMCTEEGIHTFTTTSADNDLDGLTGTVICSPNPDAMGLLTAKGKHFWVRGWERPIIPAWVMMPGISLGQDPVSQDEFNTWIDNNVGKGFNGVHIGGFNNAWYDWDCDGTRTNCGGDDPSGIIEFKAPHTYDWAIAIGDFDAGSDGGDDEPDGLDVDRDGRVTIKDIILVARNFGRQDFEADVDVDVDGQISVRDIIMVARNLGL